MDTGFKAVIANGHGNTLIITALVAAAVANSLPTPADALYFYRQQKLKQQLQEGKISVEKYWYHDVGGYYIYTTLWYLALIGVVFALDGSFNQNKKILLAMTGAGLVVGVTLRNIKKDKDLLALQAQVKQNSNA